MDCAVAHHHAVAELDHAVSHVEHGRIVGGHDGCHALLAHQAPQQAHDAVPGLRVELAGRLIGQQQGRLIGQRAGDGDALLLAAGELVRPMVGAVGQAHQAQQVLIRSSRSVGSVPISRSGTSTFSAADRIGSRPKAWKIKPMRLRRKATSSDSDSSDTVRTVDHHAAGAGSFEGADQRQQRGLARSGAALDRDQGPALDAQVNPANGTHHAAAHRVLTDEALRIDHRSVGGSRARRRSPPRRPSLIGHLRAVHRRHDRADRDVVVLQHQADPPLQAECVDVVARQLQAANAVEHRVLLRHQVMLPGFRHRGATSISLAVRPSRMAIVRLTRSLTSGSWVTTTIVTPFRVHRSEQVEDLLRRIESSSPVGSSANRTAGRLAMATAIETRCCSPPERRSGRWSPRSPSPTSSSS